MNNVSLSGRLTRDPEVRYGSQDNSTVVAAFSIAVDDGKETDFLNVKCFGKTAQWAERWLRKGNRVEVTGKIKTGSYTNRNNVKVYYTEIVANSLAFGETKAEAQARAAEEQTGQESGKKTSRQQSGPMPTPDDFDGFQYMQGSFDEDELPFN